MMHFQAVNDIALMAYSLVGLFLLALEHRLRAGGLWRWLIAKALALRSAVTPQQTPKITAQTIGSDAWLDELNADFEAQRRPRPKRKRRAK